MMDKESEKIVNFEVCHVKQSTSSQAMKKRGFKLCLDRALNSGIPVGVVGTGRLTGCCSVDTIDAEPRKAGSGYLKLIY